MVTSLQAVRRGRGNEFEARREEASVDLTLALTILGTVLGVVVPTGATWLARRDSSVYSWKRILSSVDLIRDQLRLRNIEPDVILAFATGGLIVADLLNTRISHRAVVCTFPTRRLTKGYERVIESDTSYVRLDQLAGKKILLVDDIVQTGSTLREVIRLLTAEYHVEESDIAIAVLAIPKGLVRFQPDIYALKYNSGKRVVFPWGPVGMD